MNPMMVEVTRGGIVESEHRVHVAIASHDGIEVQGDGERLTFPRSAAKLMQALPLVESGAAHRAGLTPEQLALACASHGGESAHIQCSGGMANSARPIRGTFRIRSLADMHGFAPCPQCTGARRQPAM